MIRTHDSPMSAVGAALLALAVVGGCHDERTDRMNDATSRTSHADPPAGREVATFAAGCFWGVEAAFRRVEGVVDTAVGYTGGQTERPTYKQVCTGKTGHAEAVRVTFDPAKVSYDRLLEVFWGCHDPTTPNRQGPDVGTQYRSAIFFGSPAQEAAAKASRSAEQASGRHGGKIVTEIAPAGRFHRAEEYHQRYLEKRGGGSCPAARP